MPHTPHSTDKKAQLRRYLLNRRSNHPHRLRDDAAIITHLRTLLEPPILLRIWIGKTPKAEAPWR